METRSDTQAFSFPSTPWEGLDCDHAPVCLQWMGEQWPMDSGGEGGFLPDPEMLNALEPLAAQRAKAYLAIQAFWHALEQAQATPENKVPWGSDYDVLDGQDVPITLEQCLGKAYAVWREHQHLTQRLASSSHGITKRRF